MKRSTISFIAFLFLATPVTLAGNGFLKFELTDYDNGKAEPTEIKLSIPLGMLEAMRPTLNNALDEADFHQGDIDLRAIWREVRAAGPNQYVEVNGEDGKVNVFTDREFIVMEFTNVDDRDGTVKVNVPLVVGDALFSDDQVDFDSVLDALYAMRGQDLMTISGESIEGRAYITEN